MVSELNHEPVSKRNRQPRWAGKSRLFSIANSVLKPVQGKSKDRFLAFVACLLTLGLAEGAFGLMLETVGPLKADHLHAQPGWPGGLLPLMGHASRVYSRDVNGSETVYFNASPEQVAEIIDVFSKMRCRDLVVHLQPSTPAVAAMNGDKYQHNIRLNVTGGIVLGMKRIEAKESSTFEPVLNVFVNDEIVDLMEATDWPNHLIIDNDVPDLAVKGKRQQPERDYWHATVNFEDGKKAVDFESGLQTTVTLWEKDQPIGIDLGKVTYKGTFQVPFSKAEIARIRKGELWMTMTVGNWATKPKRTDTKLNFASLNRDPTKTKPVVAPKPALFYGQILFEDDMPAILDPLPWPGAEIQVSFPYAGMVGLDAKGKFQISLTQDQLKHLKAKRDRKNIYIPSYTRRNQSSALYAFPVSKLSTEKAKPGVFKIARPEPLANPAN